MVDEGTTGASAPLPRCMWCSAALPSESEATCPSCGATLISDEDSQVPGVTAIDAEALVRGSQATRTKSRSRLMSWISGEYDDGSDRPSPPGSVSLPPPEVRREMLRLEIDAEVRHLQAEAESIASEAAVEQLIPIEVLNAPYPSAPAVFLAPVPPVALDATAEATPDAAPAAAAEDEPTA